MNLLGSFIIFWAIGQPWFFFSAYFRISTAFPTSRQAGGGEPIPFSSVIESLLRQLTAS
jgi:hypothetical protein